MSNDQEKPIEFLKQRRVEGPTKRLSVEVLPEHGEILSRFPWGFQKPFFAKLLQDIANAMEQEPNLPVLYVANRFELTFKEVKNESNVS